MAYPYFYAIFQVIFFSWHPLAILGQFQHSPSFYRNNHQQPLFAASVARGYQPPPNPPLVDEYSPFVSPFQTTPSPPIPPLPLPPSPPPPAAPLSPLKPVGSPPAFRPQVHQQYEDVVAAGGGGGEEQQSSPVLVNTLIQVFASGRQLTNGNRRPAITFVEARTVTAVLGGNGQQQQKPSSILDRLNGRKRVMLTRQLDTQTRTFIPEAAINPMAGPAEIAFVKAFAATNSSRMTEVELKAELGKELDQSVPLILEELERVGATTTMGTTGGGKDEDEKRGTMTMIMMEGGGGGISTATELEGLIGEGLAELESSRSSQMATPKVDEEAEEETTTKGGGNEEEEAQTGRDRMPTEEEEEQTTQQPLVVFSRRTTTTEADEQRQPAAEEGNGQGRVEEATQSSSSSTSSSPSPSPSSLPTVPFDVEDKGPNTTPKFAAETYAKEKGGGAGAEKQIPTEENTQMTLSAAAEEEMEEEETTTTAASEEMGMVTNSNIGETTTPTFSTTIGFGKEMSAQTEGEGTGMTSIAGGGDGTTATMAITEGFSESASEISGSSSGATMGMAQTSEREGETTELRKSAAGESGGEEEGITTSSSTNTETTINKEEEMQSSSSSSTINAKDMGREEEGQTQTQTQTDHAPFQTSDGFQLDFTMGADGGIASSEGTATMMTNEGEGMQKGEEGETTIQDSTTTTSSSLTTTEEEEGISSSSSSPPLEEGSAAAEEDHSSSTEAVGMGMGTTIQGEGQQQQQEEGAEEQMVGQGWEKTDFEAGQLCYFASIRKLDIPRGVIFAKDFHDQPECFAEIPNNGRADSNGFPRLDIEQGKCGLVNTESTEPPGGNLSLLLMFAPRRAVLLEDPSEFSFLVQCFAPSLPIQRQLSANLAIQPPASSPPIQAKTIQLEQMPPNCEYSLRRDSPNGPLLEKAILGQTIFHRWECKGPEKDREMAKQFGIFLSDCVVANSSVSQKGEEEKEEETTATTTITTNGGGKQRKAPPIKIELINSQGCSTDSVLLSDPEYSNDHLLAFSRSKAFSLRPGAHSLRFECRLSLCLRQNGGCQGLTPPQCSESSANSSAILALSRRHLFNSQVSPAALRQQLISPPISLGLSSSPSSSSSSPSSSPSPHLPLHGPQMNNNNNNNAFGHLFYSKFAIPLILLGFALLFGTFLGLVTFFIHSRHRQNQRIRLVQWVLSRPSGSSNSAAASENDNDNYVGAGGGREEGNADAFYDLEQCSEEAIQRINNNPQQFNNNQMMKPQEKEDEQEEEDEEEEGKRITNTNNNNNNKNNQ